MAKKTDTKKKDTTPKTIEELRAELVTKQNDFIEAKKGNKLGELVNQRVITITRREIARLKTAIRAHELAQDKENK
jgi:ribosomal protein L29